MSQPPILRGVFAPTLTPFRPNLSVDIDRWITFCQDLLAAGCHGLCPFGTTSEANSLGLDERMTMLEELIAAGAPAERLMPGAGLNAIPETVRLTAHATRLGCAGVLLLPPFYYKGVSDDGIFRFMAEVIERTGDQRLRVYLYHIPPVAQIGFSLPLIERLRKAYPQTIAGVKDSSGDWKNQEAMLKAFPGFGVFSGSEKFLLDNLRLGGVGGINAIANAVPGQLRKLYEAWQSPEAAALQERVMVIANARGNAPAIPVLKAITAHYRQDPAWRIVRPPFTPLPEDEARQLLSNLHEQGFQYEVVQAPDEALSPPVDSGVDFPI